MRAGKRKRVERPVEEGAPAWMVTYSDMITLVLAFFVLLFSFAVIDEDRFNELLSSLRITFLGSDGVLQGSLDPADLPDSFFESDDYQEKIEIIDTIDKIESFIAEKDLQDTMEVYMDDRGIVLEISDALLFDPAEAEIKTEALEVLTYVADLLDQLENQVVVEGHTDTVPINTFLFPSNWELSVARSVVVVRYLVEEKGLDPIRFAAKGFGEYHPIASNSTSEGRAKNRRVNIIISSLRYNNHTTGEEEDNE